MTEGKPKPKRISVVFLPDETNELPILHANSILVQTGVDEFIVTIGVATPPEDPDIPLYLPVVEKKERVIVAAKPLTRIALSRNSMEQFIEAMEQNYQRQIQIEEMEEKGAKKKEKEEKS